jgi:hypothetical protein
MQLWKIRQSGVNKVPAAEFTDSETEIRCVDLDPSGNIAVSGSDDGNTFILFLYFLYFLYGMWVAERPCFTIFSEEIESLLHTKKTRDA